MGLFDKLVKKDEISENEEKSVPIVEQTAAKIDNPMPVSEQTNMFSVDPKEILMGGTKEDEITKIISEVVQKEEKNEAVIELMSGSAVDAIVMSTEAKANEENTISQDDSFEIEKKDINENINTCFKH